MRSLRTALRNRLDRAPLHARAFKAAAQRVDITGWRAPWPGHRIDQALRHARAIGAAAWHAKRDRVAIAGTAAIAVAIAAWFLVPSDRPASPEAPRPPDMASPRDDVGAPAVQPPEPPQAIAAASAPPQAAAAASAPPQERPPDTTSARLLARLKPALPVPALATRLKPPVPEETTADPVDPAPPASQSPEATDTPQERGDPRPVDSMASDGHGLSRRADSAAGATLLR